MRRDPAIILREHAGARESRVNRKTGTIVTIYDAEPAGLDPNGGRWVTLCEDHHALVNHDTLALARSHMPDPTMWCSDCQGLERAGEKVKS